MKPKKKKRKQSRLRKWSRMELATFGLLLCEVINLIRDIF